jgi:acetylornithine/succinyldiaminopimelate/putrescine aminotransferase
VHQPVRVRAAAALSRVAPWPDAKTFFVNSGTEANETALKIARRATGRAMVLSFDGGFHGRTLGALAVCGMPSYREPAAALVDPSGAFECLPWKGGLDRIDERVAAVIVEPIQSMGGMRALGPAFARALRARCDDAGALLVFDEIQTAPARTGHWFAGERWDVAPDLVTTAKGVAGGFPAGAVLAPPALAATVRPGDQGTTFGGGPLACAAIEATLRALEVIDGPARARAIETRVREGLAGTEVLGHGALLGVRVPGPETARRLRTEHRVLAGGCPGDATVMRLFPPLTIDDDALDRGIAAIRSVLR